MPKKPWLKRKNHVHELTAWAAGDFGCTESTRSNRRMLKTRSSIPVVRILWRIVYSRWANSGRAESSVIGSFTLTAINTYQYTVSKERLENNQRRLEHINHLRTFWRKVNTLRSFDHARPTMKEPSSGSLITSCVLWTRRRSRFKVEEINIKTTTNVIVKLTSRRCFQFLSSVLRSLRRHATKVTRYIP